MSSPPAPFSFLSFFPDLFSCSTAPQAFSRPDRHMVAGRRAQMLSRLAASSAATTLWGALAFTAIEHDGRLDGSGVDYTPDCYLSVLKCQARIIPITDVPFLAGLATKSMAACDNRINLYPAAPIRLAKVLLAWTIAQAGWGSSF